MERFRAKYKHCLQGFGRWFSLTLYKRTWKVVENHYPRAVDRLDLRTLVRLLGHSVFWSMKIGCDLLIPVRLLRHPVINHEDLPISIQGSMIGVYNFSHPNPGIFFHLIWYRVWTQDNEHLVSQFQLRPIQQDIREEKDFFDVTLACDGADTDQLQGYKLFFNALF